MFKTMLKPLLKHLFRSFNFRVIPKSKLTRWQQLAEVFVPRYEGMPLLVSNLDRVLHFHFGYLQVRGSEYGTLWLTHDVGAGFFSCLVTMMWNIIEISTTRHICYVVDNSLSMNSFKEQYGKSTWYELFDKLEPRLIDELMSIKPNNQTRFDHHSSYHDIIEDSLGREWVNAFIHAYMSPSPEVLAVAKSFDRVYKISTHPTIAVCYRGTDKRLEIQPTPIEVYIDAVNYELNISPDSSVLIQTDQAQVRDVFISQYGDRCKFIAELPVTRGVNVIHSDHSLTGNKNIFARNLYAMCLAVSKADCVITHTGNVGFFLAMHALLNGKSKVRQFP
jgi:hypothetical protein